METLLDPQPDLGDAAGQSPWLDDRHPASVTVTRTSESDFKSRQLIVWIDGLRIATLLWGDSITTELPPGRHRVRVSNTLVWKTLDFDLRPGEQAFFEAINRTGVGSYLMLLALGAGPLYVTLKRMT
jgi:hypothetical protein